MALLYRSILLICTTCLPGSGLLAQNCTPTTYYFPAGNIPYGYSLDKTADGGYMLVGALNNATQGTGRDVHIIRSDAFGNEIWAHTYSWEGDDTGTSIRQLPDEGYVVVGTTDSPSIASAKSSILLFRIDAAGNLLWQTTFGSGATSSYSGNDVEIAPDGSFIIAGAVEITGFQQTTGEMVMIKTDPDGNVLAQRRLTLFVPDTQTGQIGPGRSSAHSVFFGANGDCIFTGLTLPQSQFWPTGGYLSVVRTSPNLDIIWQRTPLDGFCGLPAGRGGLEYDDGSLYIVIGEEWGGCFDYFTGSRLVKMEGNGNFLWSNPMGLGEATDLITAPDGNLAFSKTRNIAKVDTSGAILWESPLIASFYSGEGNNLRTTANGGYLYSGRIGQAAVLVEFDSLGNHCTNTLEGTVFVDADGDCIRDSAEIRVENAILKVTPDGQFANTDANGFFRFQVDSGDYSLQLFPPNALWEIGCPLTTTYNGSFGGFYQTANGLDFGLQPLEDCPLLNLKVNLPRARTCTETSVSIHYCNDGTVAQTGVSIEVQLDQTLNFVDATRPWALSGDVYTFQLGNLDIGQCGSFSITVFVECGTAIGSQACVSARILPANNCTLEAGHDQDESCRVVRNSYDPNDKIVNARDTAGCWLTPLDKLEFTVRFQNTGNDTAYRVVILDTLSTGLDLSTVQPGPASHPYRFKVLGPDVLMFIFENINLPDSTTNRAGSQGHVQFSIQPNRDLTDGAAIRNQAAIYFDSNEPIITEEVLLPQCVLIPLTVVQVVKNPVTDCREHNGQLEIQATGGLSSYEYSIDGGLAWQAEPLFTGLSPGQYEVRVRDEAGNEAPYFQNPVAIVEFLPEILEVETHGPSSCSGSEGTVELQVLAPGVVYYSIDGGNTFQETPLFEGLSQGAYQVVAVNECLAGDTASNIVLTDPDSPQIQEVTWQHPVCEMANGSIRIQASGVQNLSYSVDGGATWLSTRNIANLSAGDYEVWVSYGEGNCAVAYGSPVNLASQEQVPEIQEVLAADPSTCNGTDGAVEVTATGSMLEFSLDGGLTFQEEPRFEGLPDGAYQLIARNECDERDTFSLVVLDDPPSPTITNIAITHPGCGQHNGQLLIEAEGGQGLRYSLYQWLDIQADPLFTNLSEGEYTVLASNDANCFAEGPEVTLTALAPPQIQELILVEPVCKDTLGTITIIADSEEELIYSIDGGANWQNTAEFGFLPEGSYEVVASNTAMTCKDMPAENPIVFHPVQFPAIDSITIGHPSAGSTGDGSLEVHASGAEELIYSLDEGLTWQASSTFAGLAAGNYEVWVSWQDSSCVVVESGIVLSPLTGSSDEMGVLAFRLYPNPSSEYVNLVVELEKVSVLQVKLISALGNTVATYPEMRTSRFSGIIPTSHLPAGYYCLQVNVDGRVLIRSLAVD
ncbi:MAG: DUF11 domain-containing protein [Lewinellaceae bacterium]|nr:DUF11 domain-containing protein [Phaeodactylibacter sp.]MCB0595053.1 DUF11 domain-containing protein [Phaeodactylibacter sp.]MCB9036238.1 DUF11 domain-containing protein [Lewinellaceae bacterium]